MREKLKKIRKEKNLTQKQIADMIGISRASYTNIELGKKNPSLRIVINYKRENSIQIISKLKIS